MMHIKMKLYSLFFMIKKILGFLRIDLRPLLIIFIFYIIDRYWSTNNRLKIFLTFRNTI